MKSCEKAAKDLVVETRTFAALYTNVRGKFRSVRLFTKKYLEFRCAKPLYCPAREGEGAAQLFNRLYTVEREILVCEYFRYFLKTSFRLKYFRFLVV